MTDRDDLFVVEWDIFPLFVIGDDGDPKAFLGTGFLVAPHLAMTCWHVIREPVGHDQRVVIVGTVSRLRREPSPWDPVDFFRGTAPVHAFG